jgi:hypothetical protein
MLNNLCKMPSTTYDLVVSFLTVTRNENTAKLLRRGSCVTITYNSRLTLEASWLVTR